MQCFARANELNVRKKSDVRLLFHPLLRPPTVLRSESFFLPLFFKFHKPVPKTFLYMPDIATCSICDLYRITVRLVICNSGKGVAVTISNVEYVVYLKWYYGTERL